MNDDHDDLAAMVCHEAVKQGLKIRPSHLSSICYHIAPLGNRKLTPIEVAEALKAFATKHRNFFDGGPANESPEQRLERANANLAKREQSSRPAPVELSSEDQKHLARLTTPAMRNDFINVRRVARELEKKEGAA